MGFVIYYLTEVQLCTFLLLELNIVHQKVKSIIHNIVAIQDNDSVICELYCITVIEYMFAAKTLLNYTNLFSLNDYRKNDKVVYKYFKDKYVNS